MKPSAYSRAGMEKGEVVEDRDQVKVSFAGGNSWHIQVEGVDEHESVRGADAAWERAEKLRAELNPDYAGPPAEEGDSKPAKKAKAKKGKKGAAKSSKSSKGKAEKDPDGGKEVMIGHLKGVRHMVPVAALEELLEEHSSRVAALRGSEEARRLSRRVRATDGRCAPVFLTRVDPTDSDEEPKLFDGLLTLAVALNLDMESVAVVMLPSGSVHEVQGMIVSMMRSNLQQPEMGDDEELRSRAHSED